MINRRPTRKSFMNLTARSTTSLLPAKVAPLISDAHPHILTWASSREELEQSGQGRCLTEGFS